MYLPGLPKTDTPPSSPSMGQACLGPLPSPGAGKRSVLLSPPCPGSGALSPCGPGAVEACLLHQLRRRAAGFLRSDKMAALFTKVGKTCPVAGEICHKVQELQQQVEGR